MPTVTASRSLKHGCEFKSSMNYVRRPYLKLPSLSKINLPVEGQPWVKEPGGEAVGVDLCKDLN